MRIVVVGTIVADTIERAGGARTESLGGIAHSVAALAALAGGAHEIVPLCRLGADCRARVERWADELPGVSLAALLHTAAPNPKVALSYPAARFPGERTECLTDPLPPLRATEVEAAAGADLVLVNCITGDDCDPAALARIRGACERVYLDVHSLALGRRASGLRFYRWRDDWPAWLGAADVVQCNRAEAATLCGLEADAGVEAVEAALQREIQRSWHGAGGVFGPPRAGAARGAALDNGAATADGVSSPWRRGPVVVALTLGARGASVFWREDNEIAKQRIPAPAVKVVDPTGAGDAFGAGWVTVWLAGAPPATAARAAVRAGSAACVCSGVPDAAAFRAAL